MSGSTGGPQVICASPAQQAGASLLGATALCFPSLILTVNIDPERPTEPAQTQQSQSSIAMLMTTLSTSQNRSSKGTTERPRFLISLLVFIYSSFTNRPLLSPLCCSPGACARQHMEVHSVCCCLGANHLYSHRVRHQRAVLVQALPQLQTSATAGGWGGYCVGRKTHERSDLYL